MCRAKRPIQALEVASGLGLAPRASAYRRLLDLPGLKVMNQAFGRRADHREEGDEEGRQDTRMVASDASRMRRNSDRMGSLASVLTVQM